MAYEISIFSNAEVVDHNPEMADFDNPRGHIIREVCYLCAISPKGRRFLGMRLGEGQPSDFDPIATGFQAGLDKDWTPENSPDWLETYPVYDSRAYEVAEPDIVAAEKAEAEYPLISGRVLRKPLPILRVDDPRLLGDIF